MHHSRRFICTYTASFHTLSRSSRTVSLHARMASGDLAIRLNSISINKSYISRRKSWLREASPIGLTVTWRMSGSRSIQPRLSRPTFLRNTRWPLPRYQAPAPTSIALSTARRGRLRNRDTSTHDALHRSNKPASSSAVRHFCHRRSHDRLTPHHRRLRLALISLITASLRQSLLLLARPQCHNRLIHRTCSQIRRDRKSWHSPRR